MLVFRSLTLGLLAACFLLLATRPTVELRVRERAEPRAASSEHAAEMALVPRLRPPIAARHVEAPTIIDVAPGVTASQLASLLRFEPGEHIASIDDLAVAGDVDAGITLARLDLRSRRYIDLGVRGPGGDRRVLVLLH